MPVALLKHCVLQRTFEDSCEEGNAITLENNVKGVHSSHGCHVVKKPPKTHCRYT